ncbi:MAG: serine/threonine-protein kinase [Polyangiaceae bacterium]
MQHADPKMGDLSFELLAEIAAGQTARVELCRVVDGPQARELVAVKRLHPHIAEDPEFVDMFRDEVWMTAALKHPHVVEVVGWGQDAGGPWLAVEFVKGVSLQRLMKTVFETGERFTERMVVYIARCICDGLAEAHDLRTSAGEPLHLVHRDLTPGNILLGFDGQVKIADFGLAKAKQRLTKTLTGLLKGQPQYMSPEQVAGGALDGRSDIFALGVLLFELFTGRRPWNATSDLDAMRAITDEEPSDLASLRPKIDKALVDIVNRCLEKDPQKRWSSARELMQRLDEWLTAHGYRADNHQSLARFVRRNAMRQMRWFDRAIAGEFAGETRESSGLGRMSHLPPPSPPPAMGSGSGTDDPSEGANTRTRDERPVASRRGRQGTVPALGPTEDGEEWADDGPTLIQRGEPNDSLPTSKRKRRRSRQRVPSAGIEATTRRQRAVTVAMEESPKGAPPPPRRGMKETVREGSLPPATPLSPAPPGDATDLGVVAPPDPAVPPPPVMPRRPARTKPVHDSATDEMRVADETGATRPLSRDDLQADLDGPSYSSELSLPPGLEAMPAPRFPSMPSLSRELPSMEVGSEARRLGEAAQRAADIATAAAQAARLAAEAAILASDGRRNESIVRLREAQRLEELIQRGTIPKSERLDGAGSSLLDGSLLGPGGSHDPPWLRWLRSREGMTIAVIALVGVLLLLLIVAIAR